MALQFQETGPPGAGTVVLLHGVGTTGWMWRSLVQTLSEDLHVLNVDLPGHGASAGTTWTTMADTVSAVADLIAGEAHGGVASVVGLSLGGYVGVDLAASRPDLVPSAVVSGVNVLPFPRPGLMRAAGYLMAPVMTRTPMLRANARALGVPAEDFDGYAEAARSMARGTFLRVGRELMDYRVPQAAGSSWTRVLAVAGQKEHPLIRRSQELIAASFPAGRARLVPDVGHAWNGERPALFADVVRAHVAAGPLPDGLAEPSAGAPADGRA
jgi:pimeloyl-ACP methyl ester carboxylesterase